MFVAFSGIGGSGKTTQIKLLEEWLKDMGIETHILVLRELFIWPKLVSRIVRKESKQGLSKTVSHKGNLFQRVIKFFRLIFYFSDSWRIYAYYLIKERDKIILCDRWFYDFFAELNFENDSIGKMTSFWFKILPRPHLIFYFDVLTEQARIRKDEWPKEKLDRQKALYSSIWGVLNFDNLLIIDANRAVDEIHAAISEIVNKVLFWDGLPQSDAKFVPRSRVAISLSGLALYCLLIENDARFFVNSVIKLNGEKLWSTALQNRCLWAFIRSTKKLNLVFDSVTKNRIEAAENSGEKLRTLYDETVKAISDAFEKIGIDFRVIKSSDDVELGTDADLVPINSEQFERAVCWLQQNGVVISRGLYNMDAVLRGFLPIDLHSGIFYGEFRYLSNEFLWEHINEAEALIIASHSFNETTLITLGDILRLKNIESRGLNLGLAYREARRFGWNDAFEWWYGACKNPAAYGFRFPIMIPFMMILAAKIKKYLREPKLSLFGDSLITVRALRARYMGKVPFHEPWFTQ